MPHKIVTDKESSSLVDALFAKLRVYAEILLKFVPFLDFVFLFLTLICGKSFLSL